MRSVKLLCSLLIVMQAAASLGQGDQFAKWRVETPLPTPEERDRRYLQLMSGAQDPCDTQTNWTTPYFKCRETGPYQSQFALRHTQAAPIKRVEFAWVPIDQTASGQRTFEQILRNADRTTFDCDDVQCFTVLKGFDTTHPKLEIFNLCSSFKLSSGLSAPDCNPVAVREEGQVWLESAVAAYGSVKSPPAMGSFPIVIIGDLPDESTVLSTISEALTKPTLSLTPTATPLPSSVVAGCTARISQIIPPWRESVTVRIDSITYTRETPAFIGIWPEVHLLVNRQNTEPDNDWHRAPEEQRQKFFNKVVEALHHEMSSICKEPQWMRGDTILVCGKHGKIPD